MAVRTNCSPLRGNFSVRYVGPTFENGVFRRKYNFEFDSPCVVNVVKTNRLRYAGHMIRMPEDLRTEGYFYCKIARNKGQRRPRSRWADGVISDSRASDWLNRVKDKEIWRKLLREALTSN
jgi:hypothetical protein